MTNNIKYFTTGKQFGTITAIINNQHFEITTLRKDIKTDGRHAIVEFTKDYIEDAKRRDFTFNALYMDYEGKIYDYFNGISDLQNGIINFIGNSQDRITEDNFNKKKGIRYIPTYASFCLKKKEAKGKGSPAAGGPPPPPPAPPTAGTYSYVPSAFFHKYIFCPSAFAPCELSIVPLFVNVPVTYSVNPFGPP